MSDKEHCFGCGKKGEMDAYVAPTLEPVVLFGQERQICNGSRGAKVACVMAAIKKLWYERRCPACGEPNKTYNDRDRMTLCRDCDFNLDYGREHHGKVEKTKLETQLEALYGLVNSISNYRRHDEPYYGTKYPAWPFSMLDENSNYAAKALMKALREMWKSAVESAHAKGVTEGANLLVGLKNGTVSYGQFDSKIEEKTTHFNNQAQEFKEQCADATRAAMALVIANKLAKEKNDD